MTESLSELDEQPRFPVEIPKRCLGCVALICAKLQYTSTQETVQKTQRAMLSGALTQSWIGQAATGDRMTIAEATSFVESREADFRVEILRKLKEMDAECAMRVQSAQRLIENCVVGVVEMRSVTAGIEMGGAACGSKDPERVKGLENVELVRIIREPETDTATD